MFQSQARSGRPIEHRTFSSRRGHQPARASFLAAAALLLTATATPPARALADDRGALASGKVLISTRNVGGDTPEVTVKAVIDAKPKRVWRLVSDCNRYEKTMLRVEKARQLSKHGNKVVCRVTIDMPWPVSDLTATTEARHIIRPGYYARRWRLLSGDYKQNRGSWVLRPFGKDQSKTLVVYTVHAIPKIWVPAWIRNKAQKSTLPDLIEKLRKLTAH